MEHQTLVPSRSKVPPKKAAPKKRKRELVEIFSSTKKPSRADLLRLRKLLRDFGKSDKTKPPAK
jgi:hypothetical protein